MTGEEIISEFLKLLKFHHSSGANIHQYKDDFFRLFKEAYREGYFDHSARPFLRGDALTDTLVARWYTNDESENERKTELIQEVMPMWNEWRYAWDHYEG